MSCVLHIEGENFDIDSFLQSTKLQPYKSYRIGEAITARKDRTHTTNGCSFDLSEAGFDNFFQQQEDSVVFLKENFEALKLLERFGLIEEQKGIIDFGTTTRMMDPNIAIQCNEFSVAILKLAGSLGISIVLSQYHLSSD